MINIAESAEAEITIGKTVANNFRTADVFKKYGIDFCCKGGRLLSDVCREKNLDQAAIERELREKAEKGPTMAEAEYQSMPVDDLVQHIVDTHHSYVRESIPPMLAYLSKVTKVHGANHPELAEIYDQFTGCATELTAHMVKEEKILFPAIKKLGTADKADQHSIQPFFFGRLENPIGMMEHEHTIEGDRFFRIGELTNRFTPPDDACTTYRVAYQKLEEFQNDLFTHIHLENNILFPKALELERELMG